MPEQVHPFCGYSYPSNSVDGEDAVNELGFRGPSPLRSIAKFKVLILGGSVASALVQQSRHLLSSSIALEVCHREEDVEIFNGALGGFRQPQQLGVLSYFLALGARFDLVINLDGFNEVALYPAEDRWTFTHPALPRNWLRRLDPSGWQSLGRFADWLSTESPLASNHMVAWFAETLRKIAKSKLSKLTVYSSKHHILDAQYSTDVEMFDELASLWARSSLLLSQLCEQNHIVYLHCLQPNQYLQCPDHPVPSEVYHPDHPYRLGAINGYPKLLEEALHLSKRVPFLNLVDCLSGLSMKLAYVDQCCHLSMFANNVLAARIALRAGEEWRRRWPEY